MGTQEDKIDNLIKRSKFVNNAILINSLILLLAIFLSLQSSSRKSLDEVQQLTEITSLWPNNLPEHYKTIVSDIAIKIDKIEAHMGYVGLHSSSPLVSEFVGEELFLETNKHSITVYDANNYQEGLLNKLQSIFAGKPITFKEFRETWDELAFPIIFMQFTGIKSWYIGTPDNNNIIWWDKLNGDVYAPQIDVEKLPKDNITLKLSNKNSSWDIMGNIWRAEDSSSLMKEELNDNEGWFVNSKYTNAKGTFHLLGTLGKPVLKSEMPLKYIPNSSFSENTIEPFVIRFHWLNNYNLNLDNSSISQLSTLISRNEIENGQSISIFGVSISLFNIIGLGLPIILIAFLYSLASIIDFRDNIINLFDMQYSEVWLLLSKNTNVAKLYIALNLALPLIVSFIALYVLQPKQISDRIIYIGLIVSTLIVTVKYLTTANEVRGIMKLEKVSILNYLKRKTVTNT